MTTDPRSITCTLAADEASAAAIVLVDDSGQPIGTLSAALIPATFRAGAAVRLTLDGDAPDTSGDLSVAQLEYLCGYQHGREQIRIFHGGKERDFFVHTWERYVVGPEAEADTAPKYAAIIGDRARKLRGLVASESHYARGIAAAVQTYGVNLGAIEAKAQNWLTAHQTRKGATR